MREPSDLWDDESPSSGVQRGLYVSISGNTGAGKSTLIQAVANLADVRGVSVTAISERMFHHPLLRRMFADPARYAFPIQLNFMLQRHLFLLRQLELGRHVVMERSHLDDEMFLEEHVQAQNVSPEQRDAYLHLASVLHQKLPVPDVFVLLDVEPSVSMARIRRSEESGGRPKEFPDEDSKLRWVRRWYERYREYHSKLRTRREVDSAFARTEILDRDAARPTDELAEELVALIERRLA